MAATAHVINGSDSEDDPDYIPGNDPSPSASDDERDAKRRRTESVTLENAAEDETARKQARDKAWADLQASMVAPPPNIDLERKKTVKIRKTHRFAGEDVSEVVEVAEDSEDAKKWPLWDPSADSSVDKSPRLPASSDEAGSSTSTQAPASVAPLKKPGRRKSRIQLGDIPSTASQKAKKLTTIEKSAMDWRAHSQSDAQLKDDLDANRRGGGYLEKVQFLNDVGDRRDKLLEENKDKKRRRG
ncbi:hypothetical protein PENSPDRAFT_345798 [Peniophora sp. CONT]|nr:hypothetical protein PENSPDRAFT_345798 [Peniophora sp. CONT]